MARLIVCEDRFMPIGIDLSNRIPIAVVLRTGDRPDLVRCRPRLPEGVEVGLGCAGAVGIQHTLTVVACVVLVARRLTVLVGLGDHVAPRVVLTAYLAAVGAALDRQPAVFIEVEVCLDPCH